MSSSPFYPYLFYDKIAREVSIFSEKNNKPHFSCGVKWGSNITSEVEVDSSRFEEDVLFS
jgi:hypothetical protein